MERVILQFMCVGPLAGVAYLRYTVLTSPNKGETAVHCCDPPLSVLFMLVSRNVFHVVSALQSIVFSKLELFLPAVYRPFLSYFIGPRPNHMFERSVARATESQKNCSNPLYHAIPTFLNRAGFSFSTLAGFTGLLT